MPQDFDAAREHHFAAAGFFPHLVAESLLAMLERGHRYLLRKRAP